MTFADATKKHCKGFLIHDKATLADILASEEEYRKAMIIELKNPK